MARFSSLAALAVASVIAGVASLPGRAAAEDRVTLGWGRFFYNDTLGDGHDRWQTGGYSVAMVRGYAFDGTLPDRPGELLAFRLRASIAAPADLQSPALDDRRYAGTLALGVSTQFQWHGNEVALGADLVATGPQTGLGSFQTTVHDWLGMDAPAVLDDQIGNGLHPTLTAELGRPLTLGAAHARPFVELQAGAETLVRLGADLTFGGFGTGDLMLRDPVTGQRYRGVAGDRVAGMSLVMGGDAAHVFNSVYLPDDGAATLRPDRYRLRAGLQWQGERNAVFYGVSYLSPEFEEQDEGQLVGGLSLNLKF